MNWHWIALGGYSVVIGVFAWDLRTKYPNWPLIPTAIMAACWPWFVTLRIIAFWKAKRG